MQLKHSRQARELVCRERDTNKGRETNPPTRKPKRTHTEEQRKEEEDASREKGEEKTLAACWLRRLKARATAFFFLLLG